MIAQLVERLPRSRVSWVRILPRAVFSLKKDKAVPGVYIYLCLCLLVMYIHVWGTPVFFHCSSLDVHSFLFTYFFMYCRMGNFHEHAVEVEL